MQDLDVTLRDFVFNHEGNGTPKNFKLGSGLRIFTFENNASGGSAEKMD